MQPPRKLPKPIAGSSPDDDASSAHSTPAMANGPAAVPVVPSTTTQDLPQHRRHEGQIASVRVCARVHVRVCAHTFMCVAMPIMMWPGHVWRIHYACVAVYEYACRCIHAFVLAFACAFICVRTCACARALLVVEHDLWPL